MRKAHKFMALALSAAMFTMTACQVPVTYSVSTASDETADRTETAEAEAGNLDEKTLDARLDLAALLEDGTYSLEKATQDYITSDVYEIAKVRYCTNILSDEFQYLNIWIPAGYVNEDGSFNRDASVGNYTWESAPIVFRNNCAGWFSSSADNDDENKNSFNEMMERGYIFVACGARSRNANNGGEEGSHVSVGKAPAPIVDLKAGIRFLRANSGVIPGNTDRIISIGGSGAGEMSTLVGATGNMSEYFPYLYDIGAAGITYDSASDSYSSYINDDVFGCMAYYPITDIDNADIAYAWMRVNSGETGVHTNDPFPTDADFTEFQLKLQEDSAEAFVDYINGLKLKDKDGSDLKLDDIRSGSYYDAILNNMTAALNAYLAELDSAEAERYMGLLMATNSEDETWIEQMEDGSYAVTDLDGFIHNFGNYGAEDTIGEVFGRNKNIPGFDTLSKDAENNAFGHDDQVAVHYSYTIGKVMQDNYDKYMEIATEEEKEQIDSFIEDTLTGDEAEFIAYQTYLMDAMEILFKHEAGEQNTTIAPHWRIRSGTADQHTSFTIGYNTALALWANDIDCDYSLVWRMIHGGEQEGTSTGTFVDWAEEIMSSSGDSVSDSSVKAVMGSYDITSEDVEFIANIFKQINEGNDPGLADGEDYYKQELELAKLGAALGNGELALWVGEIYQGGHVAGISEDEAIETAIKWWNKATELGQPRGLTDIGLLYAHKSVPGGGENFGSIEQDDTVALDYFTQACEAGDTKAPRYLAQFYEAGRGSEVNYEKALEYYLIAADLNDITALGSVGAYYLEGKGCEADYEKALEYLTKAATSEKVVPGVADARYNLGKMYEEGLGVEKDIDQAIEWYTSAAQEGSEEAKEALENLK